MSFYLQKKQSLNIKIKETNERKNPAIYHGFLYPIFVYILSEKYPTKGVARPSAIWPHKITSL